MVGDFFDRDGLEPLQKDVAVRPGGDGDHTTTAKQDGYDDTNDKRGVVFLRLLFIGGDGHFRHDFSPFDE
jgi:hypothetical protein